MSAPRDCRSTGVDPWRVFDQVVCSLDAVKPLRRRSGWSPEQVEAHNAARFRALLDAGWDMVIIDEAHHVAGSSEDVARHQLAVELTGVAPNVLLLSATPHSGKSDGFRRFLGLLDDRFLRGQPVARSTVAPYVVRTEKRQAVDNAGRVLFHASGDIPGVAPYTRPGDGAGALRGRDRVCAERLERCQAAGTQPGRVPCPADAKARVLEYRGDPRGAREALCRPWGRAGISSPLFVDRPGRIGPSSPARSSTRCSSTARGPAWATERAELTGLLRVAREAAAGGADAKVRAFFDLLGELRRSERDPNVKVLVFTEFVQTQDMLLGLLDKPACPR